MKFQWRTELFSWSCLGCMGLLAAWAWPRVPERIPVHWNASGEVDSHGGRFMGLLLLPLISAGLYFLLLVVPKLDPGKTNYEGFAKVYTIIRNTLMTFLSVVYTATTMTALGWRVDMARVITMAMGLMFMVLGNYLGKVRPNWFVGVRTPWTLSSKRSWTKTHRLSGWLFLGCGVAAFATGVVRPQWSVFVLMGTILPSTLVAVIYSYFAWRTDPDRQSPAGTSPAPDGADAVSPNPAGQ